MTTITYAPGTTRQVGKMRITVISDHEAKIERVFDAPRRLVWEALSKPAHIPHWWGPARNVMTVCELVMAVASLTFGA